MDHIYSSELTTSLPFVKWEFSFAPFLQFTEDQIRTTDNKHYRKVLEYIAGVLRDNPQLLEPVADMQQIDQYEDVLELVQLSQATNFSDDKEPIYGIGIMNPMQFISKSPRFREIMDATNQCADLMPGKDLMLDDYYRQLYRDLLRTCYCRDQSEGLPRQLLMKLEVPEPLKRYYHLEINTRFVTIKPFGELPDLRQEWIDFANGTIASHQDLVVPLDLNRFVVQGFLIFTLVEATTEEAVGNLSATIANMHTMAPEDTFRNMREATLSLLGEDQLQVGLMPFLNINGRTVEQDFLFKTSKVYRRGRKHMPIADLYRTLYAKRDTSAAYKAAPLVYNEATDHIYSTLIKKYLPDGVRSIALFPVWHQDNLLGLVEVVSPQPNAMTTALQSRMEQAMPMFREFLVYQLGQIQDHISRLIMNQYTAIHPSVSWKFREAAWQQISAQINGHDPSVTPDIRFEHLFPFYGAVDIRNSSLLRQQALRTDFQTQLRAFEQLIAESTNVVMEERVQEKLEEIRSWQRQLQHSFDVEEEIRLQAFIDESVQWVQHWQEDHFDNGRGEAYIQALTDSRSSFHAASETYEASLQQINTALKEVLEQREKQLQEEIPHYFEHFKSDGWEYNLYAGHSIAPWHVFPEDAFQKISRWQLRTMVEMAAAAATQKSDTQNPLETTQLIFTHANNISIYFRKDERHFDVDGAYSIRYEVIKKRIDKVRIAGSSERLTRPGTIAVVYATRTVADVYERHMQEMIEQGLLLEGIEHLDLEELQGAAGLRALRVQINPSALLPAG